MGKFEIPLDQAAKEFYEIEGRYHALYNLTRMPTCARRLIKDCAAQARHLALIAEKEAKKHGY